MRNRWTTGLLLSTLMVVGILSSRSTAWAVNPGIVPGSTGDPVVLLPFRGLRPTGTTLALGTTASDTTVLLSDASTLAAGQIIEVIDTGKYEIMSVTGVTADGNPLTADPVNVLRGQHGTAAASHTIGKSIYADFSRFPIRAENVTSRGTGVTLAQAVDAASAEVTGSILTSPLGASSTTAFVSDAYAVLGPLSSLGPDPIAATFDGVSYVSVSAFATFLGSTGRSVDCDGFVTTPRSVFVRCWTVGATPADGPSGSGVLARVTLKMPETVTLAGLQLSDVKLSQVNPPSGCCPGDPPITVQEVLGGQLRIGTPAPPGATLPDPTAGLVSVYVSPKDQTSPVSPAGGSTTVNVDVKANNIPAPGTQSGGGHGLGGYEFKLSWDPAPESITVTGGKPGHLDDAGVPWDRGVTLTSAVTASDASLPVSDAAALQAGWAVLLDSEQMLITSVGASSVTVARGYRETAPASHSSGAVVYAGPDRVSLTRAAVPSTHIAGTVIKPSSRVLRVSNAAPLAAMRTIEIDSERFRMIQAPASTLSNGGAVLLQALSAATTSFSVQGTVNAGSIMRVDSEYMAVLTSSAGTVTVTRGFWGTLPASHNAFAPIWIFGQEANTVRVTRAAFGTAAAAHASGTAIFDPDGLGAFAITVHQPVDATSALRAIRKSTWLGSTGRTVTCPVVIATSSSAAISCTTAGDGLGPQGTSELATVDASGLVLEPNTPARTMPLSGGSLADASGDDLAASTSAAGKFRVVKCPDVNGDRVANFPGDVINIAKASFSIIPPLTVHDINNDGIVNFPGDTVVAAKLVSTGQPTGLRCPPA